jgi:hypothetical protein
MVWLEDACGTVAPNEILVRSEEVAHRAHGERDQNALEGCPKHALLGTQRGPRRNLEK